MVLFVIVAASFGTSIVVAALVPTAASVPWWLEVWTVPGRVIILAAMLAAWASSGPGRARRPLQLLALATVLDAAAFPFFARPAWDAAVSTVPVGDVLQLASYVATVLALLSFGRTTGSSGSVLVAAMDLVSTVGGFGLVVWTFLIQPAPQYATEAAWIGRVVEVGYPVLDVVLLFALYFAWRSGMDSIPAAARSALVLHVLAIFAGDALWGVTLYMAATYATVLGIASFQAIAQVALALFALSAIAAGRPRDDASHRRGDTEDASEDVDDDDVEPALSPVSAVSVTVAVLSVLGLDLTRTASGGAGPVATIGVGTLGLLVVARQVLVSRRNRAWMRARRTALEHAVEQRTRELAAANARLERLATVDGLTGVANRYRFETVFDDAWSTCMRTSAPLSVLMLDVDAFKAYNDRYGHPRGDACLVDVAQIVVGIVHRSTDLVARYGGEEFAVICVGTDSVGARELAESIRLRVAERVLPHDASPIASHVTVSIGVATTVPRAGDVAADLVRRADEALYEAKRSGRDKVVVASA